jgi:cobalt-zinc-cadmium efflux system protein
LGLYTLGVKSQNTRVSQIISSSGEGHSHGRQQSYHTEPGQRLLLALALTGVIFLVELAGGMWTGSLALLSDAAHVFLDVTALGLSYVAFRLAALPPNARHSYGYRRAEILAALANGLTLLVVAVGIGREAWERWQSPAPVLGREMLAIAVVGLVANLAVAGLLRGHTHGNLNIKSAFLHVLGDALASVGVIVAGVIIMMTGWYWADSVASLFIGLLIAFSAWGILRESIHILMEGAPAGLNATDLAQALAGERRVLGVHDLHVWNTGSGSPVLSAHIRIDEQALQESQALLASLRDLLRRRYGITHTTLQLESLDCGQTCGPCLGVESIDYSPIIPGK